MPAMAAELVILEIGCLPPTQAASEEIQMQISTATLRGILATSPDAAVCMRDVRTMVDFGDVTLAVTGIRTPVVRVFGPAVDRVMRLVGALPVGGVCASATAVSLLPDEVEEYFRRLRVQPAGARIRVQVYQLASLATFRDILQPAPAPAAPAGHTSGSGLNSAKRGRGDSRRPPLGGRVAPAVVAGLSTPIDQASGGQAPVGQGGGR